MDKVNKTILMDKVKQKPVKVYYTALFSDRETGEVIFTHTSYPCLMHEIDEKIDKFAASLKRCCRDGGFEFNGNFYKSPVCQFFFTKIVPKKELSFF